MKKIFLIGSCRISRPFNCDKRHKEGKYNLYDCLNTKWHEKYFLGSLYESNYIIQTLQYLIDRNIEYKDNIQVCAPQKQMDEIQFLGICEALMNADIIIIEIATIKFLMNDIIYLSNEHFNKLGKMPIINGILNKQDLMNNIMKIEQLAKDIGKKVLFISHFNNNNIPNRALIIECLKASATHFFDPSSVIDSDNKLLDQNHYTLETELEIMEQIHNHLSIM